MKLFSLINSRKNKKNNTAVEVIIDDKTTREMDNVTTTDGGSQIKKDKSQIFGFGKQNVSSNFKEQDIDLSKKYEGLDFEKLSKQKLFDIIYELIIELKKKNSELNKNDTENLTFFDVYKKTKVEKKDIVGQLEYLARKISPSYIGLTVKAINYNLTPNMIIEMILKDYLSEKKSFQETIIDLKEKEILNRKILNDLEKQILNKKELSNDELLQVDQLNITEEEIYEHNTIISEASVAIIAVDLDKARDAIGDVEFDIIEILGKEGISLYPEILNKCINEKKHTESRIKTAFGRLEQFKIINSEIVKTAKIKRGVRISELTAEVGQLLFKEKFGINAIESESSRIIKDHGNLIHGYSIKEVGIILDGLGYIDISTSRRENTISIGENRSWIPDVIATNPITNKKEYFEIEFGNHTQENFDEKMTKANLKANVLRFIVPSELTKEKIKHKVEYWKARLINRSISMTVTIGTINELETKSYGFEIK